MPDSQPPPTCRVSRLRPEQFQAACSLLSTQLAEHGASVTASTVREIVGRVVADERLGFILVALDASGTVIGIALGCAFLGLEHGGPSGWLEELYVRPEWRGRGIGSALVAETIRTATALGWHALDLEVDHEHLQAEALYARFGFQRHTRSRFWRRLP